LRATAQHLHLAPDRAQIDDLIAAPAEAARRLQLTPTASKIRS
jgi:hypothetical protein